MIYVLGIFVLSMILVVIINHLEKDEEYFHDSFGFIVNGTAIAAFVSLFIGGGIAFGVGAFQDPTPPDVETYTLEMLNDTKELNGSFFLASGSFKEDPYFYFYKNNGEYSVLDKMYAPSARIVESNDTPKLVESYPNGHYGWWYFKMSEGYSTKTFYIPEGSITNDYTLGDLND